IAHIRIGEHMQISLPIQRPNLHDALTCLHPIGAGIHPERTANGAGNAVIEMKSANTGLQSCSGYPFVRRGRTCADTRGRDRFHFPEATSRKADDETLYAAV